MSIDFNVSPYYDDYFSADGGLDKNYFKVLFRPGRALQARELTTAQSILQNQLGSFGRTYFPEGGSVYGSQRNLDNPFNYVVLNTNRTAGSVVPKTPSGDGFLNFSVGDTIVGGTSGVKAIIGFESPAESITDPNMMFVKYISSAQTSNTTVTIQQTKFLNGESLYFANTTIQDITTELAVISNTSLNSGIGVTIDDGIIFTKDVFVHTLKQSIIVNKWLTTANARIGYVIANTIATSADDIMLKDIAQGYPNYTADGADRQRIELYLTSLGYDTDWVANEVEVWSSNVRYHKNKKIKLSINSTEVFVCILDHQSTSDNIPVTLTDSVNWIQAINFVEIGRLKNGQWVVPVPNKIGFSRSTYDRLKKWVERRDAQIHGDFTIKPYGLTVKENDVNGLKIAYQLGTTVANTSTALLSLDYGHSFKNGHEVVTQIPLNFITDKPRTARFIKPEINATPNIDYGNYILIKNLNGYFDIQNHETVSFYSANTSVGGWSGSGNLIGTAKIRYFDIDHGRPSVSDTTSALYPEYRAYLYNFKSIKAGEARAMKGNYGQADTSVSNTLQTSLIGGNINLSTSNVYSQLLDTGSCNKALFELMPNYVQEVSTTNSANTPVYYTIRDFQTQWVKTTKTLGGVPTTVFELRNASSNTAFTAIDFGSELNNGLVDPADQVDLVEKNYTIYNMNNSLSVVVVCDSITHTYTSGMIVDPDFIAGETSAAYRWSTDPTPKLLIYFPTADVTNTVIGNQMLRVKVGLNSVVADTKTFAPANTIYVTHAANTSHQGYDSNSISFYEPDIYSVDAIYMANTGNTSPIFPRITLNTTSGSFLKGEKIYELDSSGVKTGIDGYILSNVTGNVWNFILGSGHLNGNYFTANNSVVGLTSGSKATIISSPTLNAGANDITDRYIFDSGQRDNYYDWGKITLKPGKSKPTSTLLIVYSKFITTYSRIDAKTFYSLNSYGQFNGDNFVNNTTTDSNLLTYSQLPVYSSPVVGNVRLRDCIDFRPLRHSNTSVTLSGDLSSGIISDISNISSNWLVPGYNILNPSPLTTDPFEIDYKHFVDKRAIVGLTSDYRFGVYEGVPGNISFPTGPVDLTPYWKLYFPPYLDDISLVQKTYCANRTYTMKDIGALDTRLSALENTVALSVSELQALSTPVPSMSTLYLGLERFKNGILLDTFTGTNVGNLSDPDYKCSIEPGTQTCRAPFTSDVIDVDQYSITSGVTYHPAGSKSYRNDNGDTVIGKDGILTLNYVNIAWQTQNVFSNTISVNPYSVINFNGKMILIPSKDNWMDTTTLPSVNIDLTGNADGWNALVTSVNSTLTISFASPPTYKIGSQVTSAQGGTATVAEIDGNNVILTDYEGKFSNGTILTGENNSGSTINLNIVTSLISGGAPGFGTQFGDWQTNWTGINANTTSTNTALTRTVSVPQTTYTTNTVTGAVVATTAMVQRAQTGTATTTQTTTNVATNQTKTGVTTSLTTQIVQTDLGPKVINVSIVPFIRTNDVLFDASGLKPNTVHYPFFNGIDVSVNCANRTILTGTTWKYGTYGEALLSDSKGVIKGIFKIPGGVFATGERTFRLIDVKSDDLSVTKSHVDATYAANGLAQTVVDQIVSTRTPIIEKTLTSTDTTVTNSGTTITTNDTWNATPVAPDINTTFTPIPPPPPVVADTFNCVGGGIDVAGGVAAEYATYGTYIETVDFGNVIGVCGIDYATYAGGSITLTWNGISQSVSNVYPALGAGSLSINKTSASPSTATVTLDLQRGREDYSGATITKACPIDPLAPRQIDPLAQTFFVDSVESPNGLFITAIDAYVATTPTDNTLPLSLELRTVVNGIPSSYILPDSQIVYNLTDDISSAIHNGTNLLTINTVDEHKLHDGQYVTLSGDTNYNGTYQINLVTSGSVIDRCKFTISINYVSVGTTQPSSNLKFSKINVATATNSWKPTRFIFEYPIYVQSGEYCFVILSETSEYELYISEMGQPSLIDGSIISKQPAIGSLYKSQNSSDWTADQYQDLAYTIYRAFFDTVNTGDVEFTQNDLSLNRLAGVTGTFDSNFNVKYNILNFQSNTLDIPKTSINWGIKTADLNASLDPVWSNLTPKSDYDFPTTRLITKGTDLLQVRALLSTSDNYVSPVIDLLNQRAIIIENIINNTVEREYETSGGGAQAKYISKSIILDKGMDAIDLKLTLQASRQSYNGSTSNIVCYMKLHSASDESLFSSNYWYPMILLTDPGYSSNATDFRKYEFVPPKNIWYSNQGGNVTINYTGDGVLYNFSKLDYDESQLSLFMDTFTTPLEYVHYDANSESLTVTKYDGGIYPTQVKTVTYNDFLQYAVKIVMISDNKSMVPLIKNVQAIALT